MKKHLLTGLIILLPIALTMMIIVFLFDFFTEPFITIVGPLVDLIQEKAEVQFPREITLFFSRFLSLIFLCVFIFILGFITQLVLVKIIIRWGNLILFRIPFIKTIYKVSRDIFAALFSADGKKAFKRPIMVPFTAKPNYCIGFEAGEVAEELKKKINVPISAVFAPTAPHPISGFLFFIPQSDIHPVDMTNEDAVKFLVSCGMILPGAELRKEDEHEHPI